MAILTSSGKPVVLARSEPQPIERFQRKNKNFYRNSVRVKDTGQKPCPGVRWKPSQAAIRYKLKERVECCFYVTVFLDMVLRSYVHSVGTMKLDVIVDALSLYFDTNFNGWDQADFPADRSEIPSRKHAANRWSKYKGLPKIHEHLWLPLPLYFTMLCVAEVERVPLGDIAEDALKFYFDEVTPGWDLAGDIPMPKDDPPNGTP